MTGLEQILGSLVIAGCSSILGYVVSSKWKVDKEDCLGNRQSCIKLLTVELEHIKKAQDEMKTTQEQMQKALQSLIVRVCGRGDKKST